MINNVHSYFILVSEPWDYSGPDGKNRIKGQILKIINDRCLLFKADAPVSLHNVQGDILVLYSRYKTSFEDEHNKGWTVGVGILLTESYENLDAQSLMAQSEYVIIGSLKTLI